MAILMRGTVVAAAAFLCTACELTRSPTAITLTEDRVLVQSVLLAGDSTARVLIRFIPAEYDPFNPFAQPEWLPIADAAVRLVAGEDTIALLARTDTDVNPCVAGGIYPQTPAGDLLPGCYYAGVPGGIASGATYELIIDLPGRGMVRGRTSVPTPAQILAPAADASITAWTPVSGSPPRAAVSWAGGDVGQHAELSAVSLDSDCVTYISAAGIRFGSTSIDMSASGTREITVHLQCNGEYGPDVPGELRLTVFDTAYSRYIHAVRENHRMVDASAGITGPAIGAFGSAASVRQPVRFVPN